jgi:hypothetical protein
MKKLIIAVALVLLTGVAFGQKKIDIEKEKEAIKAVIEEERNGWFDGDNDRVEAAWHQESTSRKIIMSEEGILEVIGWKEINTRHRKGMTPETLEGRKDLDAQYLNYNIIVYGNTALAYHDCIFSGKWQGQSVNREQKRILHLIKIEGEWKLDLMASYMIPQEQPDK